MSRATFSRPLVYIAGPYTKPDPVENTRKAIEWGERVEGLGAAVFIPHLSLFWHFASPAELHKWYDRDNHLLERCDAVFRFDGESTGADNEVALAESRGLPVFTDVGHMGRWVGEWFGYKRLDDPDDGLPMRSGQ